jgi:group I intron endonuclease
VKGSGIYQILNKVNGKRYIGSSVNLRKRENAHLWHLKKDLHFNKHLQRAWSLYGVKAFTFEVLEYVSDIELLISREQHYIDTLKPEYNLLPTAGSMSGFKHSEESRQKISKIQLARYKDPKEREKTKEIHLGAKRSDETRQRISEAATLRFSDPKEREKIKKAKLGKKPTEKTLQNMSKSQMGRKHNEETKQKISEAQQGEKNHNTNLTEDDVRSIKTMLSENTITQREIAKRHGVSPHVVHFIKAGKSWSCVN